jgi:MFS family permease
VPCYEPKVADETEQAIAAISASAKQARKPTPRWMWLAAALLGIGGAIAFAVAMLTTPDASEPTTDVARGNTGRGFGAGLVIGLVAGIGIGVAVGKSHGKRDAQQRECDAEVDARQRGDHSSRSKP